MFPGDEEGSEVEFNRLRGDRNGAAVEAEVEASVGELKSDFGSINCEAGRFIRNRFDLEDMLPRSTEMGLKLRSE